MKKYFYNFYLIIKNINNYGFITFFYATIIEIYYLFKFFDFRSYIHDNKNTSTYQETKTKLEYDTQHTPTPYFFLTIASKFINEINYEDFIIVDMGCGYGRVGKYFISNHNSIFYGLEINKELIDPLKSYALKNKNFKVFHVDLRDEKKSNSIFDEIKKLNKKIIIFFSDPFDINAIIKVLSSFSKSEHVIIGVNVDNLEKLFLNYKIKHVKYFQNKLRHVVLLEKK